MADSEEEMEYEEEGSNAAGERGGRGETGERGGGGDRSSGATGERGEEGGGRGVGVAVSNEKRSERGEVENTDVVKEVAGTVNELQDSERPEDGQATLQDSERPEDGQATLQGSERPEDGQATLQGSERPEDSRATLQDSEYPPEEYEDPKISDTESGEEEETLKVKGQGEREDKGDWKTGSSSGEEESCFSSWLCSSSSRKRKLQLPSRPSKWSSRDTARYREGYPGKRDDTCLRDNYLFYTNEMPSRPYGYYIDDFHKRMTGNYQELEWNHSYIQWLFPIREQGMNWKAQELQLSEVKGILADEQAKWRLKRSYDMMLDFYGMKMKNRETGELERTPNYKERFHNLNTSSHNYLRITRILKCLGEFEMEHLKAPFIRFVLHEAIEMQTLRNVLDSCMSYWVEVLKSDDERKEMWQLAKELVNNANRASSQSNTGGTTQPKQDDHRRHQPRLARSDESTADDPAASGGGAGEHRNKPVRT